MDRRGCLETGGVAVASGLATAGVLRVGVGAIDWALVLGVVAAAAIAAAANYRGRTGHAANVAEEAPPEPVSSATREVATEYVVSAAPPAADESASEDGDDGDREADGAAIDGPDGDEGRLPDGGAESAAPRSPVEGVPDP